MGLLLTHRLRRWPESNHWFNEANRSLPYPSCAELPVFFTLSRSEQNILKLLRVIFANDHGAIQYHICTTAENMINCFEKWKCEIERTTATQLTDMTVQNREKKWNKKYAPLNRRGLLQRSHISLSRCICHILYLHFFKPVLF